MDTHDLLTIGEVVDRSGFPASALRFYEREGLLRTTRTRTGPEVTRSAAEHHDGGRSGNPPPAGVGPVHPVP